MRSLRARRLGKRDSSSEENVQGGFKDPDTSPTPFAQEVPRTGPITFPSDVPERVDRRLPEGAVLQGRYRILGVLGLGGMGAVYKAQDLRFPNVTRLCVVKEMINTTTDPEVQAIIKQNFEREANILATLSHPGIVQVYDCFSEEDRSYLVLEYVDGTDLGALLAETEGFLPEETVVRWAIYICGVLSYLHSRDPQPIVFRDLKPSNIMLDRHRHIRLVDFGIARIFQGEERGTTIGTEGYSPPEQYRGIAEPRVDIYALGATMHHLLGKRDPRSEPPFSFHERPISDTNPTVSNELIDVIDRALAYEVDSRYASAEEMRHALMKLRSARDLGRKAAFGTARPVSSGVLELWRFACQDLVRSSPTVHNGVVYVGCYDHNLYALRVENGEFLWKYGTEGGVASSPCVHGRRVLFGSGDRLLYAVNTDSGRLEWTCPTQGGVWSTPTVALDHAFFGSDDGHLYAVNFNSGRVAWTFEADGKVRSSPAVGDDVIYVGCESGGFYAVSISGQARWRFRARRGITSSPATSEQTVHVGSQDWTIYALDSRSGWPVWRCRTEGPVVSSPAVSGGVVYVGSVDQHMYAVDAGDGRVVWRYATEGQVTSSPCVAEGAVYFGSVDGGIYCVDAQTGSLRWRFQTDGPVTSSPTVVDGVVIVGSDDSHVYALPA